MPNSSKMSGPVISETKQNAIQQLEQIIIITLKIEIRTMKKNSARREGDRRDKQIENYFKYYRNVERCACVNFIMYSQQLVT